jgi:hypothetical protein
LSHARDGINETAHWKGAPMRRYILPESPTTGVKQ